MTIGNHYILAGTQKSCIKVSEGCSQDTCLLKWNHEESDDSIMYHINHAVCVNKFLRVIVASADADVFICLMYHFE